MITILHSLAVIHTFHMDARHCHCGCNITCTRQPLPYQLLSSVKSKQLSEPPLSCSLPPMTIYDLPPIITTQTIHALRCFSTLKADLWLFFDLNGTLYFQYRRAPFPPIKSIWSTGINLLPTPFVPEEGQCTWISLDRYRSHFKFGQAILIAFTSL